MENQYKTLIFRILILSFCLFGCRAQQDLEFEKDISPIIASRCMACHHENGIAPIVLDSYSQWKKYRKSILIQLESGRMPPWPANPHYSEFSGQLCLRPGEKDTLLSWLGGAMKEGGDTISDFKIVQKRYLFPKPDTLVSFGKSIKLKGDGIDKFFLVSIPFDFACDTLIKSLAFFPGNHALVHHVNGHLVQFDDDISDVPRGTIILPNDSLDPESAFTFLGLRNSDGTFPTLTQSAFNYLPGVIPVSYPEGIGGFNVRKSVSFLLRDIHYGPAYRDTTDISKIGIYFARQKPERQTREIQMGTLGISDIEPPLVIPAGTQRKFRTRYPVTRDLSVLTINPHMHRLGWSFKAYAYNESGDTIPLIHIPRWDFNWQYFYTFVNPVRIPRGYIIQADGEFNNTINNPFNPFHPPRDVSERAGSMRTSDEMFQFILTVLDYQNGDENIKLEPDVPRGTN